MHAHKREKEGKVVRTTKAVTPTMVLICVFPVIVLSAITAIWILPGWLANVVTDIVPVPSALSADAGLQFKDDQVRDKRPHFDPDLVDSRPFHSWEVNQSAAVIGLDCPAIDIKKEAALLELRPTYRDALKTAKKLGREMLPSANLLDGAAKQFDDGLYAALDLACYRGELGFGPSAVEVVKAIFEGLPHGSAARPYLGAALELAGMSVELASAEEAEAQQFVREFMGNEAQSKPIGFYTWTDELGQLWRVFRFLAKQQTVHPGLELAPFQAVATVLAGDPVLLEQYRAMTGFYNRLTNPQACWPVDRLIEEPDASATVAFLPPSTSPDAEFIRALVGPDSVGLPADGYIVALIKSIRSGKVDLTPREEDGWYQYQAYALETLLVPGKGQENEKLLLTAAYKKHLVEAFKAMLTKRRETHARQFGPLAATAAPPKPKEPVEIWPRLRVEPCATFYLRTARAYAFLQGFLLTSVGAERLSGLHGLREGGLRKPNLAEELEALRQRFYGFYLIACEDIGMRPRFLEGEPVPVEAAWQTALDWLDNLELDNDLACDTRVSVPVVHDPVTRLATLWATLGVRLTPLRASYARPPVIRAKGSSGSWSDKVECVPSDYVIAVDEFAEVTGRVLNRKELRALCDKYKTKERIVEAWR